jgi:hypothetical protein
MTARYDIFNLQNGLTPEQERRHREVEDSLIGNPGLRGRLLHTTPKEEVALVEELVSETSLDQTEALDLVIWVRLQIMDTERVICGQEPRWPEEREALRKIAHDLFAARSRERLSLWDHLDAPE